MGKWSDPRSEPRTDTTPTIFSEADALVGSIKQLLVVATAGSPLNPQDYALYSGILADERTTPTALAKRLGIPLTTAIDQIARLEARGDARRLPNGRDRRASLVRLTPKGLAAHRGAAVHYQRAYNEFVRGLATGESEATGVLRELRGAVDSARESLAARVRK